MAAARPRPQPSRTISVGTLLMLFVLLIVLPAWGFAAFIATKYALAERNSVEAAGRSTARMVAQAFDFRLVNLEAALKTLSLSLQLKSVDLQGFYEQAQAVAGAQRVTVALVGRDGRQILNTSAPFGTTLPPALAETRTIEALAAQQVQYSRLFWGEVSKRWLMSIASPVVTDGAAEQVLVIAVDALAMWGEVLASIELPDQWAIALLDEANIIAARRPGAETFIGKTARPEAVAVIKEAQSGWGLGSSIDGRPVYVFYNRLNPAPWSVVVAVPVAEVDGAVEEAVAPVVAFGMALLLATMLAAWLFGRRFTSQLVAIAGAATAFRGGSDVLETVKPTRITELAELKATLDSATAQRTRYEGQLKGLIADKDLLMQEIHHRVKNSLQLVRGILSLQARSAEHPEAKAALSAAATRIVTVADVHQHLYQGHSTAEVQVRRYLEDLASDLGSSMLDGPSSREVSVAAPDVVWPTEKITALGLIVTELTTNAIKYGDGQVVVALKIAVDQSAVLTVEDEGPGFPEGFDLNQSTGLGSRLIYSLVRADEGSVEIDRAHRGGRVVVALDAHWREARTI